MLKLETVSKKFRAENFGVRDVSLELTSGVIGLLGPNGAGKTTLMQMIATVTSFWFVIVNDKGETPMFDFAGIYGGGGATTVTLYAALSAICVAAALLAHSYRLRRS